MEGRDERDTRMAKKRSARRDPGTAKPKQLRKRLHKAEDQLQNTEAKRDRAQARVDALSIIADEIRAQLAEVEAVDQVAQADDAAEQRQEAVSSESRSKSKAKSEAAPDLGEQGSKSESGAG